MISNRDTTSRQWKSTKEISARKHNCCHMASYMAASDRMWNVHSRILTRSQLRKMQVISGKVDTIFLIMLITGSPTLFLQVDIASWELREGKKFWNRPAPNSIKYNVYRIRSISLWRLMAVQTYFVTSQRWTRCSHPSLTLVGRQYQWVPNNLVERYPFCSSTFENRPLLQLSWTWTWLNGIFPYHAHL